MKVCSLLVVAAALVLPAQTAKADHRRHAFSAADALSRDCQSDSPALRGMCLGYLAAMADALEVQQVSGAAPRRVCDPATVSLEDYRRAVLDYLKANPALLKQPSSEVVPAAYAKAWPCKG